MSIDRKLNKILAAGPARGKPHAANAGLQAQLKTGKIKRPCEACGKLSARPEGKAVCLRCRKIRHIESKYGLKFEKFQDMWTQQRAKCRLCEKEFSRKRRPVVDHCHITGKVRGLLCKHCNSALGFLRDNPITATRAAEYLLKAQLHAVTESNRTAQTEET